MISSSLCMRSLSSCVCTQWTNSHYKIVPRGNQIKRNIYPHWKVPLEIFCFNLYLLSGQLQVNIYTPAGVSHIYLTTGRDISRGRNYEGIYHARYKQKVSPYFIGEGRKYLHEYSVGISFTVPDRHISGMNDDPLVMVICSRMDKRAAASRGRSHKHFPTQCSQDYGVWDPPDAFLD